MNFSNGNEATISSYSGTLLFYTNGCSIANYQNEMLENGDNINAGSIFNSYCSGTTSGYPSGTQSTIVLPLPQSDSIYYLFHKRVILITNPLNILTLEILYSVVDMSANNGAGQVMFSPDGSRYIRYNPKNKIRMFDFDRSTGLLSNCQNIDVDFGDFDPFDGGMAISPSG